MVLLLPRLFNQGDIMALGLFTPEGLFNTSMIKFTIINSYSTKGWSNKTHSVLADHILPSLSRPTLTLGHLNLDHPSADPLRSYKQGDIATCVPYFDKATVLGYTLINTLGV